MRLLSIVVSCFFFVMFVLCSEAQVMEQRYMNSLPLSSISGGTITVRDAVDVTHYAEKSYKVLVKLVYGRESHTDVKTLSFSYGINYSLSYLNQTGLVNATSVTGSPLVLSYNGTAGSNTEAYQSNTIPSDVNNWCGATLTVTSVSPNTTPPSDLRLEVHLICTYRLTPNLNLFIGSLQYNGTAKEFVWPYQVGAIGYQLEWVYIDSAASFSPAPVTAADYFGVKEPVRVMLKNQNFHFEPKYEVGQIYARVRAVWQYGGENNVQQHYCAWQYMSTPTQISIVRGTPGTNQIQAFEVNKNWQYSTTFVEGGKTGQSVAYYDGSLRPRQNIALMNSENIEVVGESLYDFEGRPVINIMPYPVASTSMNYRFRENVFVGEGATPNKAIYDTPYSSSSSVPLDSSLGASNYYSSSNTIIGTNNTINAPYIPRAKGYAYSQIQYMQDGTGRPMRQNIAGNAFVLNANGGNFTSYYYDQAKPMEIQRLFGQNVGNPQHYQKHYVMDNNGQISVSYIDQFGKVIATALAGNTPTKDTAIFTTLPDNLGSQLTVALTGQNKFDASTGSLISVNNQMNMIAGTQYTLHYDLKGVIDKATATFPSCNACSYDLNIVITDPDGYTFSKKLLSNMSATSLNCSLTNFSISPAYDTIVTFNKIGSYKITKTLTLNKASMDVLTATIAASPLAPSLASIQATFRAAVDYSSCDLTCRDRCMTANPTWDPFSSTYDHANHDAAITAWIAANCDNTADILDNVKGEDCAGMLQLMTDEFPSLGLTNVTQHPEYCHYQACIQQEDSKEYDQKMGLVSNWTAAVAAGYHNPLNMTQGTAYGSAVNIDVFLTSSPYTGGVYATYLTAMKNKMITYWDESTSMVINPSDGQTVYSLWEYCNQPGADPQGASHWSSLSAADQDVQRWRTFYALYNGLKQQVIYQCGIDPAGDNCPYRNSAQAIVQDPMLSASADDIQNLSYAESTAYCSDMADLNATAWMSILSDSGCTSLSYNDSVLVHSYLKGYCFSKCSSANPLGILDAADITIVAAGNMTIINNTPGLPDLKRAYDILNALPACGLLKASYINPYTFGPTTTLPTTSTTKVVNNLAHTLVDATNALLAEARQKNNVITSCPSTSSGLILNQAYSKCFGSSGYYYQYNTLLAQIPLLSGDNTQRYTSFINDEALQLSYGTSSTVAAALQPYMFSEFVTSGPQTPALPCGIPCGNTIADFSNDIVTTAGYYFLTLDTNTYTKIPKSNIYSIENPRYNPSVPVYAYVDYNNSPLTTTYMVELDAILLDASGNKYNKVIYLPRTFNLLKYTDYQFINCGTAPPSGGIEFAVECLDPAPTSITITTPATGLATCSTSVQPSSGAKTLCGTTVTIHLDSMRNKCQAEQLANADFLANQQYQQQLQDFTTTFLTNHITTCFSSNLVETFYLKYSNKEYQYTLYYYDQVGDLVATVPPEGVFPLVNSSFTNGILNTGVADPVHKLQTYYRYNSVGQLVYQQSPDGGISQFFYDSKGELRLSQNAKQLAASSGSVNHYSYTKYDGQSRPVESGEVTNLTQPLSYFTNASTHIAALALLDNTSFPSGNTYKDVSQTYYDAGTTTQTNLRGRVATTITLNDGITANARTSYSYDVHGNVNLLIQEPVLNQPKVIAYSYDLISGIVKRVDYQQGYADQYSIRYSYDADNRLRNTYSSFDNGLTWKEDAENFYYLHGPLARMEYGQNKVQGMDYAYTLQGWLKMGNTTHVRTQISGSNYKNTKDIGSDGIGTGLNQYVGQDEFAYALGYYKGDYSASGASADLGLASDAASKMNAKILGSGLYNGNITWQITQLNRLAETLSNSNEKFGIRASAYQYDQLNRLVLNSTYIASSTTGLLTLSTGQWRSLYTYDRNGNLRSSTVIGNNSTMDQFTYNCPRDGNGRLTANNQLTSVTDGASAQDATYTTDINSGQIANNYTYDAIGNLIGDVSDGSVIDWTVSGKVRKVTKSAIVIDYNYDGTGNRVSKKVTNTSSGATTLTQYVRDAAGTVLASYIDNSQLTTVDVEYNLYGSSRIGRVLASGITRANVSITQPDNNVYAYKPGVYQYELSNHLGNVQAVITGLKLGEDLDGVTTTAEMYHCSIVSLSDYYPFGMEIEGRTYVNVQAYRFGFNGKEKDVEGMGGGGSTYDYGFRIYNPQIGKFLSVDPITSQYPELTPYQFASNTPIVYIDIDGLEGGPPGDPGNEGETVLYNQIRWKWVTDSNDQSKGYWVADFSTQPIVPQGSQLNVGGMQATHQYKVFKENSYNITSNVLPLEISARLLRGEEVENWEIGIEAASFLPLGKIFGKVGKVVSKTDFGESALKQLANFFKNNANESVDIIKSRLTKSIDSFDKLITEHTEYIANPKLKYGDAWDSFTDLRKSNEIHHWQQDIKRAEANKAAHQAALLEL